jgi:hypothetical protein
VTAERSGRRGEPLVALVGLLFAWVGARAMFWESPFPVAQGAPLVSHSASLVGGSFMTGPALAPSAAFAMEALDEALPRAFAPTILQVAVPTTEISSASVPSSEPRVPGAPAHTSLAAIPAASVSLPPPPGMLAGPEKPASRWSGDAWLLIRPAANAGPAVGALGGTYGATQGGAVVRYRLGAAGPRTPFAYLRATASPRDRWSEEAAMGLAARPLASVPVRAQVELRLAHDHGAALRARPAAFAVTELAPVALPLGARAEVYAAAGYVGGRGATAFAEAQARIDRALARVGRTTLRAGGGAWGGAQRGASRLDLGPGVTIETTAGKLPLRASLDYRLRVAGKARPGSGVALTLSTGF